MEEKPKPAKGEMAPAQARPRGGLGHRWSLQKGQVHIDSLEKTSGQGIKEN